MVTGLTKADSRIPLHRAWLFLGLAVGWTWLFWLAANITSRPFADPFTLALFVIGAAGVPGAAFLLLFTIDSTATRRDYWQRLIDVRRLGVQGWLVALLLPPTLAFAAATVFALHTGSWPEFAPLHGFLAAPLTLLSFLMFVMLFGPLPEELGWRGYALNPLQLAYGALAAALLLGAVHALWHLPLFYLEGSHQYGLGAFSPAFWRYMLSTVALSIIITWLFNATKGSTLSAILMHYANNLTGEMLRLPELAEWYRFVFLATAAAAMIIVTRGRLAPRA